MSGVVRTVGRVAGAVASVASLIPGGQLIAGIAGAISVVAGVVGGSGPQPAARGSVSDVLIEANAPTPIGFGQSYIGGALVYEEGYGQDDDIPNPYLAQAYIYSNGPIESIVGTYSDFTLINFNGNEASGYYNDFMFRDLQLGSKPESNALALQFSGARRWGASYGLSGYAAGLFNLRFDREGERFASKRPTLGVVGRWNKCYDPRLDSTRAGGNGSHRVDNAATHTWTRNPALAALQYGLGFYTNGLLDFGIGWPLDSVVIEHFIALANICDINGWTCDGHVFEPANKWDNFNDILAAAGARGSFVGGRVGIRYNAPRIAVDVIGPNDLAAGEISVQDGTDWASRLNTLIPRYRMSSGQWPYVDGEAVSVQEYIDQDGEVKEEGLQFNMVTNQNQAAQLAAYVLVNGRELGPISLTCKERFRNYSVGDVLTLDLGDLDDRLDNVDCIIERRVFNPATMSVNFDLTTETDGKHDFALGRTDIPPALPELPTGEEFDRVARSNRFVDLSTEQVGGELPSNKQESATFVQSTTPPTNKSAIGQVWLNSVTGAIFERVGDCGIVIGDSVLVIGDTIPFIPWKQSNDTELEFALRKIDTVQENADVTALNQATVSSIPAQSVYKNSDGTLKEGQFTRPISLSVVRNGDNIISDSSITFGDVGGSLAANADLQESGANKGDVTITPPNVSGMVVIPILLNGSLLAESQISFNTVTDSAVASGGGSAGNYPTSRQDNSFPTITTTAFEQIDTTNAGETPLIITVAEGQTVRCRLPAQYRRFGSGSGNALLIAKWAYRIANTTDAFVDIGTEEQGSAASQFGGNDEIFGSINLSEEITLTSEDYEFRILAKLSDNSTGGISIVQGDADVRVI